MTTNDLQKALSILDPVIAGYEMLEPQVWAYAPEHDVRERLTRTRRAIETALLDNLDLDRQVVALVTNADTFTR